MVNIDILLDETIRKAESGTFTLTIFQWRFHMKIEINRKFWLSWQI